MEQPLNVLAVDDYAPSRYAHGRVLRGAGFAVLEAETGRRALELAETYVPGVVLLDLNLPDLHGFEVCKRLKQSRRTARIPVIHLTNTSRGDSSRVQSMMSGAEDFLEEPVGAEDLIRAVRGAIPGESTHDVLLLSPYPDECEMYAVTLRQHRVRVTCGSPDRGEPLVRNLRPDLVITRIRPEESGLALASIIKSDPEISHIPVIVITTYADAQRRTIAETIGVDEYFLLPLRPDALADAALRRLNANRA